jgi:hypothetical protein
MQLDQDALEAAIGAWFAVVEGIDPKASDDVPVPPSNLNDALQSAIAAYLKHINTPRLIETAPRDGTDFIGYERGHPRIVFWQEGIDRFVCLWSDGEDPNCTEWLPLPVVEGL